MAKIKYIEKGFKRETLAVIEQANRIIDEYQAQGFKLTLRQLYYQFVARDLIPNKTNEYNKLGSVVNNARLAGLIDWNAIEDRTRNLEVLSRWNGPADIMAAAARGFHMDRWRGQDARVEVWIEKEALAGVFEDVCNRYDVPFLSCRGYTSQSEMWAGAMRMLRTHRTEGQRTVILHFGDHDPSGIDMTRDIVDRMRLFGAPIDLKRLALNFDQVEEYGPPPNPAKATDSRFESYMAEFGTESWELDALEPRVLTRIVEDAVEEYIDRDLWDEVEAEEQAHETLLRAATDRWDEVAAFLDGN